ncbi:glycosyltransferase family 4 protein [Scytonema tolypothrichoides VB-61278]|nr:glycosyltransferase family 4 protein [Scytonema tolypothrichoides VB-61278]
MKVILLNNYSMTAQWEQWKEENYEYPSHHLWGATTLPKYGINVDILPYEKYSFLKKISNKVKILGDLDQQLRLLFGKHDYDIIYSGNQGSTYLLAILRAIGILRKPVVTIQHQSFKKSIFSLLFIKLILSGYDRLFCLSNGLRDHLIQEFNLPEKKVDLLEWGIDISCYNQLKDNYTIDAREEGKNSFILSAGRTYRDYKTLIKAFQKIKSCLKIYSAKDPFFKNKYEISSNVKIVTDYLSWREILIEHEKAYAIAIPLDITQPKSYINVIGVTSLLDAMGMGKAVVMTRTVEPCIDIEKEGIGIFVEPGDEKKWQEAISYLLENPDETREMGNRSRRLCEKKYNLEVFTSRLSEFLKDALR